MNHSMQGMMPYGSLIMDCSLIEIHHLSQYGDFIHQRRKVLCSNQFKEVGKEVSIKDTTPYTSMQKNYNPLEAVLFS